MVDKVHGTWIVHAEYGMPMYLDSCFCFCAGQLDSVTTIETRDADGYSGLIHLLSLSVPVGVRCTVSTVP